MKRRSFFAGLAGVFGAAAVLPEAKPETLAETPGVAWQPTCGSCKKTTPVSIFVPLDRPVGPGVQCPFCLCVYDTTTLGEAIKEFNARESR